MNKLLVLFSLLSALSVSADRFVFYPGLSTHDNVATLKHLTHADTSTTPTKNLRFAHLVSKLGKSGDYNAGFGSAKDQNAAVHEHPFLKFETGEKLTEVLGFSDCSTWHVTLLGVYAPAGSTHRLHAWVKDHGVKRLPSLNALSGFLFAKLVKDHFTGLVNAGLPAHPLTHVLLNLSV